MGLGSTIRSFENRTLLIWWKKKPILSEKKQGREREQGGMAGPNLFFLVRLKEETKTKQE